MSESEMPVQFNLSNKSVLSLCLFENVKNAKELREKIFKGTLEACFVKSTLVLDVFQLLVASNKAVISSSQGTMKTKSLYTEILYNLSPTRNIKESLITFGISDDASEILAAVVNDPSGEKMKEIMQTVEGTPASANKLTEKADIAKIKKIYKVKEGELSCGTLLDAIVTKMAVKDIVSL